MLPFVYGIIMALIVGLGIGPGLIVLANAAVNRGFLASAFVVFGIYSSDVIIILFSSFVVAKITSIEYIKTIWEFFNGAVVLIFGIFMLISKTKTSMLEVKNNTIHYLSYYVKGFLINITNPMVFIFWVSNLSILVAQLKFKIENFNKFLVAFILSAIVFDLIKGFIFSKIKRSINPRILIIINRFLGFILLAIGIYIIVNVFL